MEGVVLRTPFFKEVLIAFGMVAFAVFGAALVYFGYRESTWIMLGMGFVALGLSIPGLCLEVTSRKVLVADAEGIFVHAYALARKRRLPWSAVVGFEKGFQSFPSHGAEKNTQEYLVIRLKRLEPESLGDGLSALVVGGFSKMDKPYEPGDIYIPALRLPGRLDDLVAQLEAYRTRMAGAGEVLAVPVGGRTL